MAIDLARQFGGEIVNFDSLLLYCELHIGAAKPTYEEMAGVSHHLIDVASISSPMNASEYANMALPIVQKLLQQKKLVYLVGGSGFYLQALLNGMYDSPTTPPAVLERSDKLYEAKGIAPFLEILRLNDLKSSERYHENDHYRVRRAVEHFWSHGTPLSQVRQEKDEANTKLGTSNVHGWELLHLHLDLPKSEHSQIIHMRTKKMVDDGLLEEVKGLLAQGFSGMERPLKSIGYKETVDYLQGQYLDVSAMMERIVISTRQLAKSQRTWFNRIPSRTTFHPLKERAKIFTTVKSFIDAP